MENIVGIQSLTEDLLAQPDLESFWERINLELSQYGINSLLYAAIAAKADQSFSACSKSLIWKSNHNPEYFEFFGPDTFADNCVTFEHCLKETVPITWHDESNWKDATPDQWKQAHAERDMGLFVGFTLPTTHFTANNYGAIGVSMAELSPEEFAKIWPEKNSEIMQVLSLLDAGMRRQHLAEVIGLSPREKEALEWIAAGRRPDQVAHLMNIGYRTVDKYINSAKRKLKARTRDQAVAKALIFKVIEP